VTAASCRRQKISWLFKVVAGCPRLSAIQFTVNNVCKYTVVIKTPMTLQSFFMSLPWSMLFSTTLQASKMVFLNFITLQSFSMSFPGPVLFSMTFQTWKMVFLTSKSFRDRGTQWQMQRCDYRSQSYNTVTSSICRNHTACKPVFDFPDVFGVWW